ncbi:MAG: outer membrane beta-barrel protein [Rickettsiales bacterium]|nr:outer membrane beta-barrel protein [Rickettsiales bacterium]
MRKIISAILLSLLPAYAFADTVNTESNEPESVKKEYKSYFSFGLNHYNVKLKTRGLSERNFDFSGWNASGILGRMIADGLSLELSGYINNIIIDGNDESDNMLFISIMPGIRYDYIIFGFLRPYIGVGIGPTFALNEIYYTTTTITTTKNNTTTYTESKTHDANKVNFSYQLKTGLLFTLFDRFDLDLGVRYSDYGGVKNKGPEFDIDGHITNFEYRLAAVYKFGL